MSYYPNLLAQPLSLISIKRDSCGTVEAQKQIKTEAQNHIECPDSNLHQGNHRLMEGLKTCCYFFDLKTGCQLIALVEAISSMWQIYQSYSELYEQEMAPKSMMTFATTTEYNKLSHRHVHEKYPMYNLGIGTVSIIAALLLFFGVKFQRKMLLLVWIYTTILCILVFMLHTLVTDLIVDHVVVNAISLALESYFIIVVLSFYLHLHTHQQQGNASEIEVLYTGTSEA